MPVAAASRHGRLLDRPGPAGRLVLRPARQARAKFEALTPSEKIDINRTKTHARKQFGMKHCFNILSSRQRNEDNLWFGRTLWRWRRSVAFCSFVANLRRFEHITCVLCPRFSRLASGNSFSTSRHRSNQESITSSHQIQYPISSVLILIFAKYDGSERCRLGASPWVCRWERRVHAR